MKTAPRLAIAVAFASFGLLIPAGSAQANAPFCQNADHSYFRTVPAHTICSERVVGRFTSDTAYGAGSYGVWAKDYIVRPFGLPEVVLQTTYYKEHHIGTALNGYLTNYVPHGRDSNHVVCGAVANISDNSNYLVGWYDNGLAAKYNLDCDAAVSRFTGLPVAH
jgi:hypothetical protein